MLTAKEKSKIAEKFKTHDKDTGSSDVQIALLSEEVRRLAEHLKKHPKDNHSRRGLLAMVARRKKLLDYLSHADSKRYAAVVRRAGIRK